MVRHHDQYGNMFNLRDYWHITDFAAGISDALFTYVFQILQEKNTT